MTNEEYIKSMSTKELAKFLYRFDCYGCPAKTFTCSCVDRFRYCQENFKKWLKEEKEL